MVIIIINHFPFSSVNKYLVLILSALQLQILESIFQTSKCKIRPFEICNILDILEL